MSTQTVWKAGNSLVITMTKRLIRQYKLEPGSLIRIEEAAGGCMRLRPINSPLGHVSRSQASDRPKHRRR